MIVPRAFALLVLVLPASALQVSYLRRGEDWLRVERGQAFVVDPAVVTVRAEPGTDVQAVLDDLEGPLAGAVVVRGNRLGFHDVRIPEGRDVLEFVRALRAEGRFTSVEENTFGSWVGIGDPMFPQQWNLNNTGQSGGVPDADVDALEAWALQDGDPSVVVAVADSGTDWNHQDLRGNIWINPGEILDGVDNDGNGFLDDIRGWDFEGNDNDPTGTFFHGTAVASVVAARGNTVGIVGMAGGALDGAGCKIMPLNVGSLFPIGSVLDDAILYALDNGADIVTLSLTVGSSFSIDAAISTAVAGGVFINCAAGNNGVSVGYPARLADVVAVASTNDRDAVSSFSNPGPEIEVAAPGESILMADLGGGYTTSSGTSFASPHVAGVAALLLSQAPGLTPVDLRQVLAATADDVDTPGFDVRSGAGRINAHQALLAVSQGSATPYGTGTPGAGGLVPTISASAVPTAGASLAVQLDQAAALAPAFLLFGRADASLPFLGGLLWVDPTGGALFGTSTDAAGTAAQSFAIPAGPTFVGARRYAQWFVVDPAAPGGVAMSSGLELAVGT